jgi:transposase
LRRLIEVRRYHRVSELSQEHREQLAQWAQSRTLSAGDVFRARLMLVLADGKSWNQIEVELHTSRPTIARWKRLFEQLGMAGLDPRHKGSAPRTATASVQARVLRKTMQRPPDGSTHWTCRKMADALGLSKSTVQRIWRLARLQPHRLDRYIQQ